MHVERVANLGTRDDVRELRRLVARLRLRFGVERMLVFGIRGVMAAAVVLILISALAWIGIEVSPGLAALPLGVATLAAVASWPSHNQAARQADQRLGLAERLATAVEIAGTGRRSGRFDGLQVQDAVATARTAPRGWLLVDGSLGRELALAAVLVAVALGVRLLLVELPRPSLGSPAGDDAAVAGTAAANADAAVPPQALDVVTPQPATTDRAQQAAPDPSLAARVQQAQAEQDAMDRLSNALGQISAGQAAADAIQRGDYAAASKDLANLGEQADQLTEAAKQQLANALNSAANGTTSDRQLAERERQAGQALTKGAYAGQQQALQQLGQQLERSAAQTMPADQLARGVGQLQQQGGTSGKTQSGSSGRSAGSQGAGQSQRGPGSQAGAGSGSGDAGASGQGGGGSGDGQQGGPGSGTGPGGDPVGDPNPRLDTAGQRVQVPTKLSQGLAVRPPDATDQTQAQPADGAGSVSEAVGSQQTGQVTPEQNLVPGQQRPVVRGYFR
ncbi:MAG: hypothetical protein JOZ81_33665 [Chloroflexi bacterium]|nr:hypothetical protein [Chloroflexota bacterium]